MYFLPGLSPVDIFPPGTSPVEISVHRGGSHRVTYPGCVDEHQKTLPKVKIGEQVLDNVYMFEYLGAAIAADGDQTVTLKHRCDVAWGRFGQYIKILMSTKLPLDLRIRLYTSVVVSTMIYGSSAWLFTKDIKRKMNGVHSQRLSLITKRTIPEDARKIHHWISLSTY